MAFFIQNAMAQTPNPSAAGGGMETLILLGAFFLILYLLVIRPQSKRNKEHKQMISSLSRNDEVVTSGGLLGRVTEVGETFLKLELANNVVVKVQKQAVSQHMPKGTLKD